MVHYGVPQSFGFEGLFRGSGRSMTDDRDKPSRAQESVGRTTARDVPFVRGAGSESEPAPRGQRPAELPRDPTYEEELKHVELAVLRDRDRRDDPSTKQGGRRGHQLPPGQPPESVTPESPGTRIGREANVARSPEPPHSSGRAVASGTLLSVGAVDPRGKTERTLETPRMFFSQADARGEAYFKPGKIPAVTVHQTLETETVKLSDSIDPRRAKTLPRIDRAALQRYVQQEDPADSESGMTRSEAPSSLSLDDEQASPRWNQSEYDHPSSLPSGLEEGQIHASLSPFRDQTEPEPSYDYDGVPTRAEPLAARRQSDLPPSSPPLPDPSTVPTHRDLPQHRIEASRPPPAPVAPVSSPRSSDVVHSESTVPASEGLLPTTASIAVEPPRLRPMWQNLAAFSVALLLAIALGWWLTGSSSTPQNAQPGLEATPATVAPASSRPAAPVLQPAPIEPAAPIEATPVGRAATASEPSPAAAEGAARHDPPSSVPAAPPSPAPVPASPRKSSPAKSNRETIF